ncbi:MAG: peptide-methionine (S)-S-oxide reductase MsrA [Gammaproteobacteria bacterium]|nr:peptide-methionine (S)-S-oxide reductase MsrA [Gammaproteobacteria bacterium]
MKRLSAHLFYLLLPMAIFPLTSTTTLHANETVPQDRSSAAISTTIKEATFAGGCFWCMEHAFDEVSGVLTTTSGYTGGESKNPTYKQVSAGGTGHAEAVQVRFDPDKVSYGELLSVFWRNIDPTTAHRQFCDVGTQYRPAIFYHDKTQKKLAEASKQALQENRPFDEPIVVEITELSTFYPAEAYHQDYHQKNPLRYKWYRHGCGRDQRLDELWGNDKSHR